jgi:lipopolysaccharide/colanic/teichoic acid biosynthesis glycosyltransferase
MTPFSTLKRGFDILVSLSALVLLWPILAVIAIAIRLDSKGPALFKQQRAGKNGKPFVFYKFRTMKVDVDPFGPSPKSGKDPRLTKVGRFLREYSLDELPPQGRWRISGLGLPGDVLDLVYAGNAARLIPGL